MDAYSPIRHCTQGYHGDHEQLYHRHWQSLLLAISIITSYIPTIMLCETLELSMKDKKETR